MWVGVGVGMVVLNKALRMEVEETDAGGLCG